MGVELSSFTVERWKLDFCDGSEVIGLFPILKVNTENGEQLSTLAESLGLETRVNKVQYKEVQLAVGCYFHHITSKNQEKRKECSFWQVKMRTYLGGPIFHKG